MNTYNIISLHSCPEWRIPAARWFQEKWEIPLEEYLISIDECINGTAPVPQWYIAADEGRIIGGAGVITNDFHDRKDLTPNICALYVEPERRRLGIAGHLLAHICKDMAAKGIGTLYLSVTAGNTCVWCRATTGNGCECIKRNGKTFAHVKVSSNPSR